MTEDFVIQFRTEGGEIVSQQMSQVESDMHAVAKHAEQLAKNMAQSVTQTQHVAQASGDIAPTMNQAAQAAQQLSPALTQASGAASELPTWMQRAAEGAANVINRIEDVFSKTSDTNQSASETVSIFGRIADAADRLSPPLRDAVFAMLDIKRNAHEMAQGWHEAREAARQTRDATEEVGHAAENTTMSVKNIAAAFGLVFTAVKAIRFVTDAVLSQERAEVALQAALANTGLAVDRVSANLGNYAKELQSLTEYSDQQILAGTAMMQGMAQLSEEALPKAMKAAIGLAAVTGRDLNQAFMMLGRAAQGNTSMLSRWGIVIDQSKSKAEQFNQLLEIGTDRFRIAEDQAGSASGKLSQLANSFKDLAENVAAALIPLVKFVSAVLTPLLNIINKLPRGLWITIAAVTALVVALYKIGVASVASTAGVVTFTGAMTTFTATLGLGAIAIKSFVASIPGIGWALAAVGAVLTGLYMTASKTSNALSGVGSSMKEISATAGASLQRFDQLVDRYKELRKETTQTAVQQKEYREIIAQLKNEYGGHLSNLDMEAGAHDKIAKALQAQRTELALLAIDKVRSKLFEQQADRLASLTVQLSKAQASIDLASGNMTSAAKRELNERIAEMSRLRKEFGDQAENYIRIQEKFGRPTGLGSGIKEATEAAAQAKAEISGIYTEIGEQVDVLTSIFFDGGVPDFTNKTKATAAVSEVDHLRIAYENLRAELEKYYDVTPWSSGFVGWAKDETRLLKDEYDIRKALLEENAKDETDRKTLLAMLDKWKADKEKEISKRQHEQFIARAKDTMQAYEMLGAKGKDYFDTMLQLREREIELMNISNGLQEELKERARAETATERLAWVRGDALLEELQQYLKSAEQLEIEFYTKEVERRRGALAAQLAIMDDYYADEIKVLKDTLAIIEATEEVGTTRLAAIDEDYQSRRIELEETTNAVLALLAAQHEEKLAEIRGKKVFVEDPFEAYREKYELIESSIEGLVYNVTQGFGKMITEGERFSVAMKDAFKNFVNSAISDIARLLARLAALWVMKSLFDASGASVPVGIVSGLVSGATGGADIPVGTTQSFGGRAPSSHTLAPPGAGSGYRELIKEVQGLRRDVYAAQPQSLKVNWSRGDLSRAVDIDGSHRLTMAAR